MFNELFNDKFLERKIDAIKLEVEHAKEVDRQMARDAREKMRAEKTETFKAGVAKKSEELKEWFANLGKNSKGE